jgi:hypothetical protein
MMKRHGDLKVGIHLIGGIVNLDYHTGKLGENSSAESEGKYDEEGEDSDGENERSSPLFVGAKAGSRKMNSNDVVESPTKNTRKRMSTIPTVDSPAVATRGKKGAQVDNGMLILVDQLDYSS